MRYARVTPTGEVFEFKTLAKFLPEDTDELSLGIRKGLIEPDLIGHMLEGETDAQAFERLREDLLKRLLIFHEAPVALHKDYVLEPTLRHNINWIPIEKL